MLQRAFYLFFVLVFIGVRPSYAQDNADLKLGEPISLAVGGHVFSLNEATINAMQMAGMMWVKQTVHFRIGGDVGAFRELINQSHNAGFKVLLNIVGDGVELAELGEAYYTDFAAFLSEVAALDPDAIEIWREMNIDQEWVEGQVDPTTYVEMLRQAYPAIKAVDPGIMVITGALNPTGFAGSSGISESVWNDDRYYEGMAEAGAAEFADCIGVRYLDGAVSPYQVNGDPRGDFPTYYFPTMIERAAAPFQGQEIPLCFTHLGYLSPEGFTSSWGEGFNWSSGTTATMQAKWLRDAIVVAEQDGRVDLIMVWNIDWSSEQDPTSGWAIIRPDNSCLACEAIGSLLHTPMPQEFTDITAGEMARATINETTPAVGFTVLGQSDGQISLTATSVEGSDFDPVLTIYDSAGNFVAFNDDASQSSTRARVDDLPAEVDLIVVVHGFHHNSTGNFILEVARANSFVGTITGNSAVNIRSGPGTNNAVVTTAVSGTELELIGRNSDGSWLNVRVNDEEGWIARFLVSTNGDVNALPIMQ